MIFNPQVENAIAAATFVAKEFANSFGVSTGYYGVEASKVDNLLESLGFDVLGNGCFSTVFTHKSFPGYVVKLVRGCRDEANITYLAWARANPSPHVPNVHHLKRYKTCQVAVLDLMTSIVDEDGEGCGPKYDEFMDSGAEWPKAHHKHPLAKVAYSIKEFFNDIARWDLHSGNVMVDKSGQLVITDPITRSEDDRSRSLRDGIERAYHVDIEQ